MERNAQASVEYLVITAFLLIAAGIVFVFALFSFSESANLAKAEDSVNTIVNNANLVGSLGGGSKVYFYIEVPDGVESFSTVNRAVNMRLSASGGDTEVYGYAKPLISPTDLSVAPGRKYMSASFIDGNVVVGQVG